MPWFTRRFRPIPPVRPLTTRLRLEVIEDRLAPAVLSVVHPSLANGTSTFASLNAAQVAFTSGDTIQIEPGSSPGPLGLDNLSGQTIRGHPAFAADTLPVVPISQSAALAQTNVTLRNLNLVFGDNFTITGAGWTIEGCAVTNTFNVGVAESLIDLDSTGTTLRNNRFTGILGDGSGGGNIVGVTPPVAGSNNLITDNTFFAFENLNMVEYEVASFLRTVTDQVVNNTFLGQSSSSRAAPLLLVASGSNIAGLTVANNTFTDNSATNQTAIYFSSPSEPGTSVTVRNNRISLPNSATSAGNCGIQVDGTPGIPRTFSLLHNDVTTNGKGTGIVVSAVNTSATDLVGKVEGNDLHRNRLGVRFLAAGSNPFVSGVDLGGGAQGSLGLNNFRGFTAVATTTAGAIVVGTGFTTAQTVFARNNIWSVADPETVIDDNAFANVDSASPLTANQSAVAALYHTFLRRSAVFSNPSDAGGWVTQLTNGTPFNTVSTSITRSAEALGLVVDKLYKSILGRDADAGGRATHVNLIVSGATVEQIQSAFFASAEYTLRFAGNVAFVHSLYQTLLGRLPSQAEVDSQVAQLPSQGRQGVATSFLASTEYRNREVTALYFDVLKRTTPPTAGEVAANVTSGLDLLSLRVLFAGTAEFFANG